MMDEKKSAMRALGLVAAIVAVVAFACSNQAGLHSQSSAPEMPVSSERDLVSTLVAPPTGGQPTPSPAPTETPQTTPEQAVPIVPVLPAPLASPSSSPATSPAGQTGTVTLADDGTTVRLRVGDRFLLNLGDPYIWDVRIADPAIVSRVVNIAVVRGAQGVYEARAAGETPLEAVGDLPCRQSRPPCLAPTRLFRLSILVY